MLGDYADYLIGSGDTKLLYKFTDIYGQEYWSREVPQ